MKKFAFFVAIAFFFFFFLSTSVLAHPGRTASDGCHYCRTRCDYWGVPWNTRHCHGGVAPVATSKPKTPSPTPKPTKTPTLTPSPKPSPINTKTKEPEETILGTKTVRPTGTPEATSIPEPSSAGTKTATNVLLGAPLALIAWIFYKYRNVIGKKKGGEE